MPLPTSALVINPVIPFPVPQTDHGWRVAA
jgi:hypothetical protein